MCGFGFLGFKCVAGLFACRCATVANIVQIIEKDALVCAECLTRQRVRNCAPSVVF